MELWPVATKVGVAPWGVEGGVRRARRAPDVPVGRPPDSCTPRPLPGGEGGDTDPGQDGARWGGAGGQRDLPVSVAQFPGALPRLEGIGPGDTVPGPAGGAAPAHVRPRPRVRPPNPGTEARPCPASVPPTPAFWRRAGPRARDQQTKAGFRGSARSPMLGGCSLSRVGTPGPGRAARAVLAPGSHTCLPAPPTPTGSACGVSLVSVPRCGGGGGVWPVLPTAEAAPQHGREERPALGGLGGEGDPDPLQGKHSGRTGGQTDGRTDRLQGRALHLQQESTFHHLRRHLSLSRPEPTSDKRP